jgi:protein-S-isoprenylcysteine O-methyltransferase Ste14
LDSIVLQDIGLTVIVIGFIILWIAVVQLGRLFTVDVAISATHTLKTEGLYKIVRHPSYLGLMLIITGLAVCMPSLVWMAVTIIAVFIAMNYRIIVEEEALTNEFGDQYRDYSEKVSKLIPWLY